MVNKSLLVALSNLRRLEKNVLVTENLLTRAFVHLLNSDPSVLKQYAKKLRVPYSVGLTARDQDTLGQDRPDMQIASSRPDVFVLQENKIQSPEGQRQRSRYLNLLRKSPAKHRLLIYVEPKTIRKRAIKRKTGKGIRQAFLTWEEVANLVDTAPRLNPRQDWLRNEVLEFLKDRKMVYPSELNIPSLTRGLLAFEEQKESVERIFEEAKKQVATILTKKQFKVSIGDDERSLSIKKIARGKLRKPMSDGYIWIWCGIHPFDKVLYLSMEIGWLKNSYGNRIRKFRKIAEANGFQFTEEYEIERYLCEGYEIYQQLERVTGKVRKYKNQSENVCKWITSKGKILPRLLRHMEKDLART